MARLTGSSRAKYPADRFLQPVGQHVHQTGRRDAVLGKFFHKFTNSMCLSMPETTNPDNMTTEEANSTVVINGEVLGNTQYMAYVIQETTGADIFRIEPETPYPTDHTTLVAQARKEQAQSFRPALKANVQNLEDYDVVFVGYPNWWGNMPMIMYSFFEQNDFSGKTIIPFNTHGGSGFSSTVSTIAGLEPNATVSQNGKSISRNSIQEARHDIIDWVTGLGYNK